MKKQCFHARAELHSWNPDKMRKAMTEQIVCRARDCKQMYRPMDGLNAARTEITCPHCNKPERFLTGLKWNPKKAQCMKCGIVAPRANKTFRRNFGLVLVRFYDEEIGVYCRTCVDKLFWKNTLPTGLIGWVSVTSVLVAPYCVVMNLYNYLTTPLMRGARRDSWPLDTSPQAEAEFATYEDEILSRLRAGKNQYFVAHEFAERAGITTLRAYELVYGMLIEHALTES